jgi:CrcB protein
MGAFTTFSTFKLENIQLHMSKKWNVLILYLCISYNFGILLAFAGMSLEAILYD